MKAALKGDIQDDPPDLSRLATDPIAPRIASIANTEITETDYGE
ncbi:hypothetical protein [Mycobacteroides abscessus]|nr:hypothetical protein [Mycobacteroides abscessus]SLL18474.1 Uncharacterised protein [Mycobacteroides abscessus subsp. abscessus]